MEDKFEISLLPIPKSDANMLNILSLAYLGDTVYDLYVRGYLVKNRMGNMNALHCYASSVVNAKAQAEASGVLLGHLTDEEKSVYKRGRNAKSGGTPKNTDPADYRKATGIEAVLGYLYATGDKERLNCLMKIIIEKYLSDI